MWDLQWKYDQRVTITPCFFSSSMAFLVFRSLILLFERLMIRSELILLRPASSMVMASSESWLKERLILVTLGMSSIILPSPSFDSLFFTSFRPFTFFTGRRYARTSQISLSFSPYPVRSSVSRFSFSQNSSMRALTLLRSGDANSLLGRLSELARRSFDLLFFLTAGERDSLLRRRCSRVEERWLAADSIFCYFSSLNDLGERTSCWTQGKPSRGSLSSRTTLMKLKTELDTPAFSTTRIWEMRTSMVAMLVLILLSSRESRVSPSLQISSGPPQYTPTFSSMLPSRSAFWKSSEHFASHCLNLRCESFSSFMRAVILAQTVLKFFTTSSQAFFSAILTFSVISSNLRLISPTSLSFSVVILRTTPSLNSLLLSRRSSSALRLRQF